MTSQALYRHETEPDPHSPEAAIRLVASRKQNSEDAHASTRARVKRWYDLYRGHFTGRHHANWRNDVHLPLTFSVLQSDVSRKQNTIFGQWPYVRHFGFGDEDQVSARKNDLLISAQLKDTEAYKKFYDFFLQADLYGTGIMMVTWRYDQDELIERQQLATPITKSLVESIRTQTVTTFDGPDLEVIDILDAFPQPGYHDINEMSWFIRRYWLDMDDIWAFEKMGVFDSGITKVVDTSRKMRSMRQMFDEKYTHRAGPEVPQKESYAEPVEIWEMWGRVPREFIPADGGTQRVITVADGQQLLRNRPSPYYHGRIPFANYSPMRDPHYFFGPGKCEIMEKLQITANKLACQKLDALDLFISPMFYANRQAGIDQRRLYTKPGGIIWGDMPPGDAIERLVPEMQGIQNAYQEIEFIWRQMQQGSGQIEDTVMGMSGSNRQTATEYQGRMQNVSVRLLMEVRMAEEMAFEPVCKFMRALNYEFLDTPQEMRMLGSHALADPITGEPVPPEQRQITLDDLYNDYDVRAMGSTQVMSKFEAQQNMLALLSSAGSHPAGVGLINWLAFFREMFLKFEFYNVNELLSPPATQLPMIQAGQMAMGGQGSGGVPTQPPPEQGGDVAANLIGTIAGGQAG